jgi:hypothetical protein
MVEDTNMACTLSPNQRRRLALEALAADRSVQRTYRDPSLVRESTRLRIREAALRLGLPPPPDPAVGPPKFEAHGP